MAAAIFARRVSGMFRSRVVLHYELVSGQLKEVRKAAPNQSRLFPASAVAIPGSPSSNAVSPVSRRRG